MNNSTKNILLGVLVVGLLGMTIAYAALSTQLRISGTASVPNVSWDIRISDLTKASGTPSAVTNQANTATGPASVAATNNTSISGLAVTLNQPGDKIQYTFSLYNNGTIDAKLGSFSESLTRASGAAMTDQEIASKFTHSIVCNPTQSVTTTNNEDYLSKSGSAHSSSECTLTIQWNEAGLGTGQTSQTAGENQTYSQSAVTLNYSAQWTYVQK